RWKTAALVGSLGTLSIVVGAAAPMPRVAPATPSPIVRAPLAEASHAVTTPQVVAPPRAALQSGGSDRMEGNGASNTLADAAARFGMKVASSVLSEAQAGLPTIAPKVSVRGSDSDGRTSEIVVKSP